MIFYGCDTLSEWTERKSNDILKQTGKEAIKEAKMDTNHMKECNREKSAGLSHRRIRMNGKVIPPEGLRLILFFYFSVDRKSLAAYDC